MINIFRRKPPPPPPDPDWRDKLRALVTKAGDAIDGPFDGEESITLLADLDAGATGTMCSAMLPDLIKPVVDHYLAGRRGEAESQYNRILPLINYENPVATGSLIEATSRDLDRSDIFT